MRTSLDRKRQYCTENKLIVQRSINELRKIADNIVADRVSCWLASEAVYSSMNYGQFRKLHASRSPENLIKVLLCCVFFRYKFSICICQKDFKISQELLFELMAGFLGKEAVLDAYHSNLNQKILNNYMYFHLSCKKKYFLLKKF